MLLPSSLPQKTTPVQFDEKSLRDMLASPYGNDCGHSILDSIESGVAVVIAMTDGRSLTLGETPVALETLREIFSWQPPDDG